MVCFFFTYFFGCHQYYSFFKTSFSFPFLKLLFFMKWVFLAENVDHKTQNQVKPLKILPAQNLRVCSLCGWRCPAFLSLLYPSPMVFALGGTWVLGFLTHCCPTQVPTRPDFYEAAPPLWWEPLSMLLVCPVVMLLWNGVPLYLPYPKRRFSFITRWTCRVDTGHLFLRTFLASEVTSPQTLSFKSYGNIGKLSIRFERTLLSRVRGVGLGKHEQQRHLQERHFCGRR